MTKPKIYYHLHNITLGYIPEGKENWTCLDDLRNHLACQLYTYNKDEEIFNDMSLDELCVYAGYELHQTAYRIK